MKKGLVLIAVLFVSFVLTGNAPAFEQQAGDPDNATLKQEVTALKGRLNNLEKQVNQKQEGENRLLTALSGINLAGGISGGSFYSSNPGEDTPDNNFLLSNFLVELSSEGNGLPVSFAAAFGETSTPSLLDSPENNSDFDIEYASVTLRPITPVSIEAGLLQPNTGYEDTYTYNNANIVCSVTGSQQPYNAYGARLAYDIQGLNLYAGYFKTRLDDEEYCAAGSCPDDSWEIGLGTSVCDFDLSVYNYRLNGLKNLTGVVIERTLENVYFAVNIDYWRWDRKMKGWYGRRSSTACAFYVSPRFGKFSIPLRFEYINQGKSMIYSESKEAKRIYTATISPTYSFSDNAYFRLESSYVGADEAFSDKQGNPEDGRVYLAAEIGYLF